MRRLRDDQAGFTLVELLVVVLLLGVVGSVMTAGLTSAFRASTHAEARVQAVTAMHATMGNVSRDIRAADSRDQPGGTTLRAAGPTALGLDLFRGGRRIRLDYAVTPAGELTERRRVYADEAPATASAAPQADGTRVLMRGLADTGTHPVFAYRDGAGAATTTLGEVREVTIRLRRSITPDRAPVEVITRVTLRNG